MKRSINSVFIVGAGFSRYAGMPLQKEFTEALLGGRGEGSGSSGHVVQYLRKFVNSAFGHKESARAKFWPELEDIFTCVDLSANTGHNLGASYKSGELRTVRRALIYRIIVMLREKFRDARDSQDENWQALVTLMENVGGPHSGFISTNWDNVIEDMLTNTQNVEWFEYGCGATRVVLDSGNQAIKAQERGDQPARHVIKMHGSANWLYCDNCRRLFWIQSNQTGKVGDQLLSDEEWRKIAPEKEITKDRWSCKCGNETLVPVSRHLATARLWIFPCSRNLGFLQKTSFVLQKTGYSLDILFLLRISSSNTCSNV